MAPVGCSSWTSLWTEIDSRAPRSPAGTVTSAGLLGRRRLRPDSRLVPQHLGHRGAIEVARITKVSTHNACARQQRIAEVRPPEIRSHRPRVAEVGASQERAVWWIAACVAPLTRAAAGPRPARASPCLCLRSPPGVALDRRDRSLSARSRAASSPDGGCAKPRLDPSCASLSCRCFVSRGLSRRRWWAPGGGSCDRRRHEHVHTEVLPAEPTEPRAVDEFDPAVLCRLRPAT